MTTTKKHLDKTTIKQIQLINSDLALSSMYINSEISLSTLKEMCLYKLYFSSCTDVASVKRTVLDLNMQIHVLKVSLSSEEDKQNTSKKEKQILKKFLPHF